MKPGQASATARLIAAATVMRSGAGDPFAAAPRDAAGWCEQFLSQTATDRLLIASTHSSIGRSLWRTIERLLLPGIISHWMRRKREIDRLARLAAAEGFSQLINLGAGLDTLCFRLATERVFPVTICADHPATLEGVRKVSRSMDSSVTLLELDLTSLDAAAALQLCPSFDPHRPTLFVIEGVMMYLRQPRVDGLLRSLASLPTPRTRLIASWMLPDSDGRIGFRTQAWFVARWLAQQSEPMLWGATAADFARLLTETGWTPTGFIDLSDAADGETCGSLGLTDERLAIAEAVRVEQHRSTDFTPEQAVAQVHRIEREQ